MSKKVFKHYPNYFYRVREFVTLKYSKGKRYETYVDINPNNQQVAEDYFKKRVEEIRQNQFKQLLSNPHIYAAPGFASYHVVLCLVENEKQQKEHQLLSFKKTALNEPLAKKLSLSKTYNK